MTQLIRTKGEESQLQQPHKIDLQQVSWSTTMQSCTHSAVPMTLYIPYPSFSYIGYGMHNPCTTHVY